jgi:rRNA metabolism SBDS family protein
MVRVEDAVIARFEHASNRFELLVDPDLALDLKKGRSVAISDLVAIDSVFKDAKKGEVQSDASVKSVFGTTDFDSVARRIVLDGEVHLTTDQRRRLSEVRRREIVAFLAANCIDPKQKAPHPPARIENALNEIRFTPDLFKHLSIDRLKNILSNNTLEIGAQEVVRILEDNAGPEVAFATLLVQETEVMGAPADTLTLSEYQSTREKNSPRVEGCTQRWRQ